MHCRLTCTVLLSHKFGHWKCIVLPLFLSVVVSHWLIIIILAEMAVILSGLHCYFQMRETHMHGLQFNTNDNITVDTWLYCQFSSWPIEEWAYSVSFSWPVWFLLWRFCWPPTEKEEWYYNVVMWLETHMWDMLYICYHQDMSHFSVSKSSVKNAILLNECVQVLDYKVLHTRSPLAQTWDIWQKGYSSGK